MEQGYLIIDIGTGNSRVGVISTDGKILSTTTRDSVYFKDKDFIDSTCFNPVDWFNCIKSLAKEAIMNAGPVEILAVSSSSQREGIVLFDYEGEPIVGYANLDSRGEEYLSEIDWARLTKITALRRASLYSCVKYLATMRKQPEIAAKTMTYTSISDWIGYMFTGEIVWERSQAMHSAAYDLKLGDWSDELCGIIGIERKKLPPIADASTLLGKIKPTLASELGLHSDTIFVVGAGDTQSAAVGTQAVPGDVVIIAGTTTPVIEITDELLPLEDLTCWISPHAVSGEYLLEVNAGSTGINYQRFRSLFLKDLSFSELEETAVKRGIPKCLVMFSWGFQLNKTPVLHGGIMLENPFSRDLDVADFAHGFILNNVFSIIQSLEYLYEISPTKTEHIIACGGGFRGLITAQAISDLSGKEVRLYNNFDQATMQGCVNICNKALKLPNTKQEIIRIAKPKVNDELKEYYKKWCAYRDSIRGMNSYIL